MKRKLFFAGCIILALVFAFVFAGCPVEGKAKPKLVDAAAPIITSIDFGGSEDGVFDPSDEALLFFNAESPDGGWIGWQWYQLPEVYAAAEKGIKLVDNGETILESANNLKPEEGGFIPEDATCTVTLTNWGVFNFVVEVSNTNSSVTGEKTVTARSDPVTLYVNEPGSTKYPKITTHPDSIRQGVGKAILAVVAEADGTLSYQWYSNTTESNKDGTVIAGATSATYESAANLSSGTYYFYVVVTNTTSGVSKTVTSRPAAVEVVNVPEANATVTLNSATKYQYVRGFGGMDVPWGNFPEIKMSEYEKMYNPRSGLGFNIMRIMIMPADLSSESAPNTNPVANMDYYISGGGGRPNYIEGVKLVNKYGGYVLASPWSPPPEWKSNGRVEAQPDSGYLLPDYYDEYAAYLKAFAAEMQNRGAPIYAISIQNEPNYKDTYDGCLWSANQMRDFFKTPGVGNFTAGVTGWGGGAATERVLIMNGESANNPNINDAAMADTESRGFIDLLARHNYGDINVQYAYNADPDAGPRYGKEMWMTEYNINSGNVTNYPNDYTWNYVWQFMNDVDMIIRQRNENAYVWWALKRWYCFIGDGLHGATEGAILPRGYALSHFAKFAKEKTRIAVAVTGTLADGTPINQTRVNNPGIDRLNTAAKVSAYLSDDGNELSVVMYTPTGSAGTGGFDLGTIKIVLPAGFEAAGATAMRSSRTKKAVTESVVLGADRTYAIVTLPRSEILSVRFTKKQ